MFETTGVGAGRVTAGLPSLDPRQRHRIDTVRKTRAITDQIVAEQKQRDAQALIIDASDDATNMLARLGRPMHANQFILTMRKLNPHLIFERSRNYPRLMGIYLELPVSELEKVLGAEDKRHICGMEAEWMPEFSQSHFKKERIPDKDNPGNTVEVRKFTGETRGWRTVLARLIRERLISKTQADRAFNVSAGRSSRNWQALTT